MGKAILVLEYRDISQGIGVLDNMFKRASLTLLYANPICIGRYLICVGGDVADVKEAKKVAEEDSFGPPFASHLLLRAHKNILEFFDSSLKRPESRPDAIAVIEARNASTGFISLDAALKNARVEIARIWLGNMLGGKFCYVLGGSTSDIQSAAAAAQQVAEGLRSRVIISPDKATLSMFYKEGMRQ